MPKNLVLYFSVYNSTKLVAQEIAAQIGADLVEIEPVIPYDGNRSRYNSLARYAKLEHDENRRPAIKNKIDVDGYDNIFIGYPMWWYTFPMIIYTLFDKYDFSGKTVIPFNTHMGSGDGGTYRTIAELLPKATVLKGLPLEMSEAERGCKDKVAKWIKSLNIVRRISA